MSGHSKWSTIKHKKAVVDAKKGQIFTKLVREITVSARQGGGDLASNPRLRLAVQTARSENMSSDTIDRAIKKGTGELEGVVYSEVKYEGYGPGGIAFYLEVLTDNKNRTTPEIKKIFSKYGGTLGDQGCVGFLFERWGIVSVRSQDDLNEDVLLELLIDYDIEDLVQEEDSCVVLCDYNQCHLISSLIEQEGFQVQETSIKMFPKEMLEVTDELVLRKVEKLFDLLDDHDDVQNVYVNCQLGLVSE